jgi:regulator of sigma E protease
MITPFGIVVALLVLGVIIVIHELGHFLVAKLFKIRVVTFSVGFGPRLAGFRYGDTDYRLSAFPLGGYVKMAGENPTDSITGAPNEFLSKPKWQRFLVASAGPAMNIVLAVALLTGLFMYGTEVPEFAEGDVIVGVVEPGSPAQRAGLMVGDRIVSIDGKTSPDWEEVHTRIMINAERALDVVVHRDGQDVRLSLTPDRETPNGTGDAGFKPRVESIIGQILEGDPADRAGLEVGDEVLAVDGISLETAGREVSDMIQDVPAATFSLTVLRDGKTFEVAVTPVVREGRRLIGVDLRSKTILIQESFPQAFSRSVDKNIEYGSVLFQVLARLIRRDLPMRSVDGPIGIIRVTTQFAALGIIPLIHLMAMISLNLAVMNLLPIPILDGGVMLLLLIESLMGRDLSMQIKERIVQAGFVVILTLMAFVLYNDVVKLLPSGTPSP